MVSAITLSHDRQGGSDGRGCGLDSITNNAAPSPAKPSNCKANPEFRSARWEQRRIMRIALKGTRCAQCGRAISQETGVGLYYDDAHGARFSGLRFCGNVWVCPVCNAKIQAVRQQEIHTALQSARDKGFSVVFSTHTIRHNKRQSLSEVRAAAQQIWRKTRAHQAIKKLFRRWHVKGYIRAMECTWSQANGWHVHFHCYYFFDSRMVAADVRQFGQGFAANWIKTAKDNAFAAPLEDNQRFELINLNDIDAASKYVTTSKTADLRPAAYELVDGQSKIGKTVVHNDGTTVQHYSYWDLLRLATDLYPTYQNIKKQPGKNVHYRIVGFGDSRTAFPRLFRLMHEYYSGMKFARALVWSRGLRDLLGVGEEQSDEDIASESFVDPKAKVLVIWNWRQAFGRSDYKAAQLLNLCDECHGDYERCRSFCAINFVELDPSHVRKGIL
jgi:hypothetical protein